VRVRVLPDAQALGEAVAADAARRLVEAVRARGTARLLLSTGKSQFTTLAALVRAAVPWDRVEAFHLDEYLGLPPGHPASFRRYLEERFAGLVPLRAMHYVPAHGDVPAALARLAAELCRAPIDVALVGIGENAHIAFNDPPADLATREPYIVVTLAPECRAQQVGEGWFASVAEVPERAVTMSVAQILQSRAILSAVPYAAKAPAVRRTLTGAIGPEVPASVLRQHPDWTLYLDRDSSAEVPAELRAAWPEGDGAQG
jgi:glucosamine-6-phosphate deaminase